MRVHRTKLSTKSGHSDIELGIYLSKAEQVANCFPGVYFSKLGFFLKLHLFIVVHFVFI